MTFAHPWFLLLLGLLALLPLVARKSLEETAGARRRAATAVRAGFVLTLILALAEPRSAGYSRRLDVVFAVDDSDSVGQAGRAATKRFLEEARRAMGTDDRAAVVVFAARPLIESTLTTTLELPPFASRPEPGATDIAAAVNLATALFEPGAARRVVLLSDGEENRGSLSEAAAAATASGVDLRIVALPVERKGDVRVEALDAPPRSHEGEPFDLRLAVRAAKPTHARLRFYDGRRLLASDELTLESGANLFVLQARPADSGVRTYRAEIEAEGDPMIQNNAAEATVEIAGAPAVLLASPHPERLTPLVRLLEGEHIRGEAVNPDGIPRTLAGLRGYRVIVLSDVAAEDLGGPLMEALAAYVRDAGGSLIMAGGARSFGPGGYLDTPVEAVLPVSMEVKERRYFPTVALVAAIDKSGSMAGVGKGQKVEVAKAAAAAAIEVLDASDEAGVVAFDSAAQWVAKLRTLGDRAAILHELGTIRAGGGTDIYPAMVEARAALVKSNRRVKHLILLSDGQSPPRDYARLAANMAFEGTTVTTVAVGSDADTYTMRTIAEAGKGRAYVADDPALLPRIFTREVLTIQRSYVVEEPFRPRVRAAHEVLSGIDFATAPQFLGYVATWPRREAELVLVSHRNDPVMALWRTGLGKAAAFTPDIEGRWSAPWDSSPAWGRLMSQIFRWAASGEALRGVHVRTSYAQGRLRITADLVSPEGEYVNFAHLEGAVVGPDGKRRAVTLRQTAPGRYEATAAAETPGAWLVSVARVGDDRAPAGTSASEAGSAMVDVPAAPEFRPAADGGATLARAAALAGGHLETDAAAIFRHDLRARAVERPLRPILLWLLPFLLLTDVAVRRVALPDGLLSRLLGVLVVARHARPVESTPELGRLRSVKETLAARPTTTEPTPIPSSPTPPAIAPTPPAPETHAPAIPPDGGGTTEHLLRARRKRGG